MGLGLLENGVVRVTGDHRARDQLARHGKAFGETLQPMRHVIHKISQHVARHVIVDNGDDPARHVEFCAQPQCPLDCAVRAG